VSRCFVIAMSCGVGLRTAARALVCWALLAVAGGAASPDVQVRVEGIAAAPLQGVLRSIDREALELMVDGESRRVPLADVRSLTALAGAEGGPVLPAAVEVVGDGGLTIGGDDLRWEEGRATLVRGTAAIELPIERLRRAVWRPAAEAAGAGIPDWLAAVPAEPAADLVAVTQPEGFELVECAIIAISPTTVTVMLDGERIPVNRRKVLGLVWVRPPVAKATPAPGATQVSIVGGTLGASTVEWRDGGLVLDGEVRVPGELLRSIDFAAGRTVSLVAVEPETTSSEPFFGGLAAIDGLASFFAPRIVTPAGGQPAWLMRPKATATWRVPDDSRRFHARAVRAASSAAVVVWARADDGAEWRQRLDDAGATPIEIDLRDARRLTIGVDFADGGVGVPVRFDDAGFEK
jgi:hypothetical protein